MPNKIQMSESKGQTGGVIASEANAERGKLNKPNELNKPNKLNELNKLNKLFLPCHCVAISLHSRLQSVSLVPSP
jgi:hypothetical protein